MDKRRLFLVFLKHFLVVYKNWEPENFGQLPEVASVTIQSTENSLYSDDVIIGCFAGHPAEIILTLVEEVTQITALVTECKLDSLCIAHLVDLVCCRVTGCLQK